jgi:hypothetical protein
MGCTNSKKYPMMGQSTSKKSASITPLNTPTIPCRLIVDVQNIDWLDIITGNSYNLTQLAKEFLIELNEFNHCFALMDPNLIDHPCVYASDKYCELMEYPRHELIGRNPKFLEGPRTTIESSEVVMKAVRKKKPAAVSIVHYTKSGKPFMDYFYIAPLWNITHEVVLYIYIQILQADTQLEIGQPDFFDAGGNYLDINLNVFSRLQQFEVSELVYEMT